MLRSKELAHDYRYFPEPDLVPIVPSAELIEALRASLPELPAARVRRFEADYALPLAQALDLGLGSELAAYFEEVAAACGDARAAANWVLNEFSAHLNEARVGAAESPVRPAALAALIGLVADDTLGSSGAKQVFAALVAGEGGGDPAAIVEARGLGQISDTGALAAVVAEIVAAPSGAGRAVPGRQGEPDGVLRRPGHEGDRRPRGAADRPAASARGARPWLTIPSCSRPARCPCRTRCWRPRPTRSSTTAARRSSRPTARCCASSSSSSAPSGDVLLFTASGTGAFESVFANLIEPGDRVLCVTAGAFGDRWVSMAQAFGADVTALECEWGRPPDPARSRPTRWPTRR